MRLSRQYIAGFFDGEGSIGIYSRSNRISGFNARTQVTQNKTVESVRILNSLRKMYGGNIASQKTMSGGIKLNWQLSPLLIRRFLKELMPHLVLKKNQAKLVLHWLDNRPIRRRGALGRVVPFKPRELSFNKNAVAALKSMKKNDISKVLRKWPRFAAVIKG